MLLLPALLALAATPFPKEPAKGIIEDFETGGLEGWTITGSFGRANRATDARAFDERHAATPIENAEGHYFALSLDRSNAETGRAVSRAFEVPKEWSRITFAILGGSDEAKTAFRLVEEASGATLRSATGDNTLAFARKSWNVDDLRGRRVRLEMVDEATDNYGFIGVDDIRAQTEASIVEQARSSLDLSHLPYQATVKQMADGWRAKYGLPGVWCAVIRDNRVVACVASGVTNVDTHEPASIENHLNVGSVSKVVTGALIAFIVSSGRIGYETTVAEVFPELSAKYPLSPLTRASLRQMLTHTAGLPENYPYGQTLKGEPTRIKVLENCLANLATREPGTIVEYSNLGYVIAAAMAERRTGSTYESWIHGPLGKKIGILDPHQLKADYNEVWPHFLTDGHASLAKDEPNRDSATAPAGLCSLTLPDLCRFGLSTLNNGGELPAKTYYDVLHFPAWVKTLCVHTSGGWTGNPDTYLGKPGSVMAYGYTEFFLSPSLKRAVIFYTNCNGHGGAKDLREAVMKAGLADDLKTLRYLK